MLKKIASIAALSLAAGAANAAGWNVDEDAYHRINQQMAAPAKQSGPAGVGGFGTDLWSRIARETADFVERGSKVKPYVQTRGFGWNIREDVYTRLAG